MAFEDTGSASRVKIFDREIYPVSYDLRRLDKRAVGITEIQVLSIGVNTPDRHLIDDSHAGRREYLDLNYWLKFHVVADQPNEVVANPLRFYVVDRRW
ncbi:MAG: hypothetical protein WC012_04110 [Thiohalomonadaceae bacterium]